MTEDETRLTRAQRDLMDSFLRRFQRIEDALGSANIQLPKLDKELPQAIDEWLAARAAERTAQSQDTRR
ncbi:MAG: hypothetical protein ABR529_11170 [Actinomycetota bacterium]